MFAVLALLVSSIWYTPMELCDDTHSIIELSNSSSVENGNFGYDKSAFSVFDNFDNYNNFHDINFQWNSSNFARIMLEPNRILSIYESSVETNFPKLEFQLSIEFSLLLAALPHRVASKRHYCVPRRS